MAGDGLLQAVGKHLETTNAEFIFVSNSGAEISELSERARQAESSEEFDAYSFRPKTMQNTWRSSEKHGAVTLLSHSRGYGDFMYAQLMRRV